MKNKFEELKKYLLNIEKQGICLAFSGGIDSSLLLYLCKNFNVNAITFKSIFQTQEEIQATISFCQKYNIQQKIIEFFPLNNPLIKRNPIDRCYFCKKYFFIELIKYSKENNLNYIIDGTNFDDTKTYRPGIKALKELGIISPFADFKIKKDEIKNYIKELNIDIYNKVSTPCIATRFEYNKELLEKNIEMVKKGEKILKQYGFINNRLRLHNNIARIEIDKNEFNNFINHSEKLTEELKNIGFKYVTLDVEGIRSGSMDIDINGY